MTDADEHPPIVLAGERVLVLLLDPACEVLPRLECEAAYVAGEAPAPLVGPGTLVRLPLEAALGLRPDPLLRDAAPRHAVVATLEALSVRAVLGAARLGVRTFHVVEPAVSTFATDLRGALRIAGLREAARRAGATPRPLRGLAARAGLRLDPPWPTLDGAARAAEAIVAHDAARPLPAAHPARRVLFVIGTLGPGGAERQLVLTALALARRGLTVEVLVQTGGADEGPNADALRRAGVAVSSMGRRSRWRAPAARDLEGLSLGGPLLGALEHHPAAGQVLALLERVVEARADVVHGWLDESGLVAALAGLLAGARRVVVGARSVRPCRFPTSHQPWFAGTYRALGPSRVVFTNNTHAGAADYAAWLGWAEEGRVRVIPNGVDVEALPAIPWAERRARRAAFGASSDAFVVAGVFRLGREKRPDLFLRALARVAADVPGLVVWHVGDGPDARSVQAEARRLGLAAHFFGRLDAPWTVAGLADASLLASAHEGLPNVVLESQASAVPPVLTDVGGAREAVLPDRTALLVPSEDVEGLASALVGLARDPARREALGAAGRAFVLERFGVNAALEAHLRIYEGER